MVFIELRLELKKVKLLHLELSLSSLSVDQTAIVGYAVIPKF
jgi:hypothetical protein